MQRTIGACFVLAMLSSLSFAADPTPADAAKLIEKLKGKSRTDKKTEKILAVELGRKKVTDADLKTLGVLTSVRELNVGGVSVTDKNGKSVYSPSGITDEGLKSIANMTELRKLQLDGANVTDTGLKHLSGLKNLTDLTLSNTKVTDAGMETLSKLPKLATLMVFETKVTESGVGVLKRAKPDIKVGK